MLLTFKNSKGYVKIMVTTEREGVNKWMFSNQPSRF